jgi:hypothetical protein
MASHDGDELEAVSGFGLVAFVGNLSSCSTFSASYAAIGTEFKPGVAGNAVWVLRKPASCVSLTCRDSHWHCCVQH